MSVMIRPQAISLLAFATLFGVAGPAQAVDLELTPFAAYRFGGQFEDPVEAESDVDIEESSAFGVAIDVRYAPDQAIQVFYSRQSTRLDGGGAALDFDVEYFQLGGVAHYPTEQAYEPYVVGTVGAARFSPGGGLDDETRFAATLGAGIQYSLSRNLALRLEARGYLSFFDSDADLFCLSDEAGANCRFRAKSSLVWQLEAQAGITVRF